MTAAERHVAKAPFVGVGIVETATASIDVAEVAFACNHLLFGQCTSVGNG